MRIHYGPGYRIYFTRVGGVVYLLLAGGDKSTQAEDIRLAKSRVPPKPRSPTRDQAKRTKGK
ncbi:hypothetical protein [Nitrospirillum bahiense]|uniref:hypothetical protein n=1 Tax=Nitrospirillum amazonense TaxID=28077 RepID=UPI003CCC8911